MIRRVLSILVLPFVLLFGIVLLGLLFLRLYLGFEKCSVCGEKIRFGDGGFIDIDSLDVIHPYCLFPDPSLNRGWLRDG